MEFKNLLLEVIEDEEDQKLLLMIEYYAAENKALKRQLDSAGRRAKLTDEERRDLGEKGRALGRKLLEQVATIVRPDTILKWYRELVRRKWDLSDKRDYKTGRPPLSAEARRLILHPSCDQEGSPRWNHDGPTWRVGRTGRT